MKTLKRDEASIKWRTEIVKFIAVALLPITLFFRRDFDFYLRPAAFCLFYVVLSGIFIIALIIIFHSLFKLCRFGRKRDLCWVIFPSLLLFFCVFLGNEISVLKEIALFRIHQDDFSELVTLAESSPPQHRIEDTYIEIPEQHQAWAGQRYIFVLKDPTNSLLLAALVSRPDTYFTYLPDYQHLPGVDCFYELAEYWYLCSSIP
jgi:hypothetical protein